jgi:hypothetical protein
MCKNEARQRFYSVVLLRGASNLQHQEKKLNKSTSAVDKLE